MNSCNICCCSSHEDHLLFIRQRTPSNHPCICNPNRVGTQILPWTRFPIMYGSCPFHWKANSDDGIVQILYRFQNLQKPIKVDTTGTLSRVYRMISWYISIFSCSFVRLSLFLSKSKNSSGIGSAVGSSSGSWYGSR